MTTMTIYFKAPGSGGKLTRCRFTGLVCMDEEDGQGCKGCIIPLYFVMGGKKVE